MKVGDYIRTRNGLIFKIVGGNVDNWNLDISFGMLEIFEENWLELYRYNDNGSFFDNKNIVKSSPHIIDLIEVGDFVNGERVNYIDDCKGAMREFYYIFEEVTHDVGHYEEEIESIVTKEQFEAMEYKIGGNE